MTKRLRIATFNLENLDERRLSPEAFADRLAVLRPQIVRLRADILCLQEVNAADQGRERTLPALDRLLYGTDYCGFHRLVSLNRAGNHPADRHNLVILSRFPLAAHAQTWHDLVKPPVHRPITGDDTPLLVEWDRPLLHATVNLSGKDRLHVVNLHLRAPRAAHLPGQKKSGAWSSVAGWAEGFFLAAVKSAGQALEARLAVEAIFEREPDALILVLGDFNAEDRETALTILRADEEDTGNGHLATRSLVPVERSLPAERRHSVIHHGRPLMLDHILVSRPLLARYVASEIHNETLGDELVSPALVHSPPDSYHAPLVAEFLFPSGGETAR